MTHPRRLALVAIAWVMNSMASTLTMLYIAAAIGGIGAGVIYGASVGNALKWFPDRRGLAAGLTAAGFGAGSALTVIPIANMIASSGTKLITRSLSGRNGDAGAHCPQAPAAPNKKRFTDPSNDC